MESWQVVRVLKRDAFGRVELVELAEFAELVGCAGARAPCAVRRVACGSRLPLTRQIARLMLARERRALRALDGLAGVPALLEPRAADGGASSVRDFVEGSGLHETGELPADFFDRLDELVLALHERGVCHNDLHKEQNVLVARDGRPWLIDFQLASVHGRRGCLFASRAREDLRHVEKHRRRYTRDGRGPGHGSMERGRGYGLRRSWIARAWRRSGKPVYNWLTRRLFGWRDGEPRRTSSGPWPRWTPAVGPRPDAAQAGASERERRTS